MIAAETVLSTLGAIVALSCCVALVFHPDYDDGLFGRAGLVCIGVTAFARVMLVLTVGFPHPTPVGVLLWLGVALFLGRHTWCFLLRARRRDETWYKVRSGKGPASMYPLRRRAP